MDTKQEFMDAVHMGREIEFSYCEQHYFESRHNENDWYIYHEETKYEQHFASAYDLLANTMLQGRNINDIWVQITIDCIL
ncbi:hypothetical protein [Anaerotignum sp.]|uniref:hypothetical protein n=1 Tax=Anaerotignum sp. TaxID=2039241 RepID=UPI002897923F|nr:hypothetical protein [Anaerotignum sp.]